MCVLGSNGDQVGGAVSDGDLLRCSENRGTIVLFAARSPDGHNVYCSTFAAFKGYTTERQGREVTYTPSSFMGPVALPCIITRRSSLL